MKQEFIHYEQALALKELGFNKPCVGYYENDVLVLCYDSKQDYELLLCYDSKQDYELLLNCAAPLYQQAFRWFREKYVLLGFIEPANGYEDKSLFAFYICDDEQNIVDDSHSYSKDSSLHFRTYEEAELACLIKLIEILKTKNKL